MYLDEIIQLSQGLLTPVIALIAVYIAYQQHKVNRARERRESRQAKLDVYKKTKRYLTSVCYNNTITNARYDEFGEAVAEADFLFPDDIADWLSDLYSVATEWIYTNEQLIDSAKSGGLSKEEFMTKVPNDAARNKFIEETYEFMDSCIETHQNANMELKKIFSKHIELD